MAIDCRVLLPDLSEAVTGDRLTRFCQERVGRIEQTLLCFGRQSVVERLLGFPLWGFHDQGVIMTIHLDLQGGLDQVVLEPGKVTNEILFHVDWTKP